MSSSEFELEINISNDDFKKFCEQSKRNTTYTTQATQTTPMNLVFDKDLGNISSNFSLPKKSNIKTSKKMHPLRKYRFALKKNADKIVSSTPTFETKTVSPAKKIKLLQERKKELQREIFIEKNKLSHAEFCVSVNEQINDGLLQHFQYPNRQKTISRGTQTTLDLVTQSTNKTKKVVSSKTLSYVKNTTLTQTDTNTNKCEICGMVSKNKRSLSKHRSTQHKNNGKIRCDFCGKLKSRNNFAKHTKICIK